VSASLAGLDVVSLFIFMTLVLGELHNQEAIFHSILLLQMEYGKMIFIPRNEAIYKDIDERC
jgi:hypothetical protein